MSSKENHNMKRYEAYIDWLDSASDLTRMYTLKQASAELLAHGILDPHDAGSVVTIVAQSVHREISKIEHDHEIMMAPVNEFTWKIRDYQREMWLVLKAIAEFYSFDPDLGFHRLGALRRAESLLFNWWLNATDRLPRERERDNEAEAEKARIRRQIKRELNAAGKPKSCPSCDWNGQGTHALHCTEEDE